MKQFLIVSDCKIVVIIQSFVLDCVNHLLRGVESLNIISIIFWF
jgi:hypothetical protein